MTTTTMMSNSGGATTFNGENFKTGMCGSVCHDRGSGIHWPKVQRIPPETDPILARELGKLTAAQREKLYEEIHGIVSIPDEEPAFVNRCLEQMDEEISKVKKRAAYNKAHFLAPSIVRSRKFRLMFLRATSFDPRAAARRIVLHFEYKAELFGDDKVAKKLTLDDMNADDLISLESASFQLLPGTDSAGRSVGLMARKYSTFKTWQNGLRAHWFRMMIALENDEQLQRKGIVHVAYDVGCRISDHSQRYTDVAMKSHILRDGLPYRLVAFHYCYDDPAIKSTLALLRTVSGTSFRLHFRDHYGSHQECQYGLMSFGIHLRTFPLDSNGSIKEKMLSQYEIFSTFVANQRIREDEAQQQQAVSNTIESATNNDVLLGRGKPSQKHPGNLQLARLIEERHYEYHSADKATKVNLSWEVVKLVLNELGGRFLEKDDASGEWKHVPEEVAREKVAYGFRSVKKQHAAARELGRSTGGGDIEGADFVASSASTNSLEDVDMVDARTGKRLRLG